MSMSRPFADESVFRVIGHPARRAILDLLRQGDQSAGELLDAADLSRATMSEHLRMLRNAELVTQQRSGRQRLYRLEPETLRLISQWMTPFDQLLKHKTGRPKKGQGQSKPKGSNA